MENNIVGVRLWDMEVGRLYWSEERGCAVFGYSPEFIANGLDIAPLTHPLKKASTRPFLGNKERLYEGLPEFIADSLPDRWGSLVFERWAEENGLRRCDITPVDKLSFIGKRGMGALEFAPAAEIKGDARDDLNLESLYGLAKRIFEQREQASISSDESLTMQSLYDVGTSAGGKHPKAVIAINGETKEIRSGQAMQGEGFEYYILKFAGSGDYPDAEIEKTYHDMAVAAGIGMMPSRLIEVEGRFHFLTKRFDRQDGEKVFTQTLAALNPDARGYADLFQTARSLGVPMDEQSELFRRMVFNVMAANVDDHSKNFSFMLSAADGWHITPAYDLTLTADLDGTRLLNRHEMGVQGKTSDISVPDLRRFAELNNIRDASSMIDDVADAVSRFREFALGNGVPEYWTDRIEEHLSRLVPPAYSQSMTGHMPTAVEDYEMDGKQVTNVSLKETVRHDFILSAKIDGVPRRRVFGKNREEAKSIREGGGTKMPEDEIKALVAKYFADA